MAAGLAGSGWRYSFWTLRARHTGAAVTTRSRAEREAVSGSVRLSIGAAARRPACCALPGALWPVRSAFLWRPARAVREVSSAGTTGRCARRLQRPKPRDQFAARLLSVRISRPIEMEHGMATAENGFDRQLSKRSWRMGLQMAISRDVHRTYRFRVYPTRVQRVALEAQLLFACDLYNAALEQRREAWRSHRRRVTLFEQFRDLTDVRAAGMGPSKMSCSAMRSPLRRVDGAFLGFFRRVKAGHKPGYPRFRSSRRYDSLTWDSAWSIRERRLLLQGIGHVKVKWHRPLPAGARVCNVTVRRQAGRWYACFSLALSISEAPNRGLSPAVGMDLGVENFAALSTGEVISGPRAYRGASRRLRIAQRRVSPRVKCSRRREKAGLLLVRLHERIRNLRRNHAHQLSRRLVSEFGLIAVEDLQIRGLVRGFLAKEISDQGWTEFLRLLGYKAEDAGTKVIRVPPGGSSQICSGCGASVPKALGVRTHACSSCGLRMDRDINAARNILRLGLSRQAITWSTGTCVA